MGRYTAEVMEGGQRKAGKGAGSDWLWGSVAAAAVPLPGPGPRLPTAGQLTRAGHRAIIAAHVKNRLFPCPDRRTPCAVNQRPSANATLVAPRLLQRRPRPPLVLQLDRASERAPRGCRQVKPQDHRPAAPTLLPLASPLDAVPVLPGLDATSCVCSPPVYSCNMFGK